MDIVTVVGVVSGVVTILAFMLEVIRRRREAQAQKVPNKPDSHLDSYLRRIVALYYRVDFRGLGQQVSHRLSVNLDAVYVPACTITAESEKMPTLTASPHTGLLVREDSSSVQLSSFLDDFGKVVILGPAGAGKSTFLTYTCLTIAEASIARDPKVAKERLQVSWNDLPIPVLLPLREFGYYLFDGVISAEEKAGAGANLLMRYISVYTSQLTGIEFSVESFTTLAQAGRCIFLLDGLDEIADFNTRALCSDIIGNFVMLYPKNRFVVSSRPEGYGGAASLGSDFRVFNIRQFSYADIQTYVRKWHSEVARSKHSGVMDDSARQEAEESAMELLRAINTSHEVRNLASNPLLLTSIAIIHYSKTELPQRRAELYELCTRVLLGEWDIAKVGAAAKALPWYPGSDSMSTEARRTQLEYVALQMLKDRRREASGLELARVLVQESPRFRAMNDPEAALERAGEFLKAVALRGGVLEEQRDDRYSFSHQTFEEYLGARRLARMEDYLQFIMGRITDSWWREVIRLVVGHVSPSDPERAEAILLAILQDSSPAKDNYNNLLLASDCLLDADRSALNQSVQSRIRKELLLAMHDTSMGLSVRVYAGIVLGLLGDPRELDTMIAIEGGSFIMGSDQHADQRPPHVATCEAFRIGAYPVTNAQYAAFIASHGYQTREHWTSQGWSWLHDKQVTQPFYWDDPKYHAPNQPVVGVSWYEASAYCRWAHKRLPTEAEWEKSARGVDGRAWPWGAEFDSHICNTVESQIGMPSPVGMFAEAPSPYGTYDLAGNVWEWCSSIYASYPYSRSDGREDLESEGARVLRGGSWYSSQGESRGATRRWLHPGARQFNFGFRVAESQLTS